MKRSADGYNHLYNVAFDEPVKGDIIPVGDNSNTLGSEENSWKAVYTNSVITSNVIFPDFTPQRVLVSDGNKTITSSSITDAELNCLSGAIANIQAQLNMVAPTGCVHSYLGSSAPTGWLICNGDAISRIIYSALFDVIGTTYGAGDGATTFNIPDFRGMFLRGAGTHGSYTTYASEVMGTVQSDQVKGHSHEVTDPGHYHTGTTDTSGSHKHTFNHYNSKTAQYDSGSYKAFPNVKENSDTSTDGAHTHTITTNSAKTGLTIDNNDSLALENRPINYAVTYIIKY